MDTDTNMDSQLLFYDIPRSGTDVTAKPTSTRQDSFVFSDFELDPSLEITQNIQDLISKEGILFPDLLEDTNTTEPIVNTEHDVIKCVEASPAQPEPMPEVSDIYNCQVSENQASEVIVISPEELSSLGFALGLGGIDLVKSEESAQVEVPNSSFEPSAPEETITSTSSGKYSHKNTLKAESPSSRSISRRSRACDKESQEYKQRRERNNVAVRKSRDKAKHRQKETEGRVGVLTQENERLQKKVDLLTKELTVLKGLFTNVGAALPQKLAMLLK